MTDSRLAFPSSEATLYDADQDQNSCDGADTARPDWRARSEVLRKILKPKSLRSGGPPIPLPLLRVPNFNDTPALTPDIDSDSTPSLSHCRVGGMEEAVDYVAESAARDERMFWGAPVPDWETVGDVDEEYPSLF